MSKKLVIVDMKPQDAPKMSNSMEQQGHKFVKAFIREEGQADTKVQFYHCTPDMIEKAEIEEEEKKAPAKKAAVKAPAKRR